MPLLWFRRKRDQRAEQAPEPAAAAPEHDLEDVTPEPAETGAETAEQKRKRRRGSRGGRGRKKPAGAADPGAEAKVEKPAPAPKKEAPAKKRERKTATRATTRRRAAPKRAPLPSAKRELLVSVDVGEQRVAILEDGKVAEVYLERPERRSIAGNIYLGTVDNVLPGMEAAFVEIGLEKNGFLYVDEIVRPELEGKRHGRKIRDLIKRGERVLVQAVKDPMKSKGARLTTEISLPGRFVVYVPYGEGLGVSRRLDDEERARLRDIIKAIKVDQGGVIVRTAAEGASAEDVARDLVFLQKLWKRIVDRSEKAQPPSLVYQEAELPLRVTRDLFTGDFERAVVDDEKAYKRVVGYLKKTSPHMVERVERYKAPEALFDSFGVDAEIRSTLNRRVDLPSGGYLVFDYAEAFTVIDVNTGRFVGGRGKNANARLEDTITKNNLEAVKEVVRQLRLRDIGGIIVIDFIDMANPANRATVEEALRNELERDRTKTYVVEISPLGLVEMTRQNVTDGPREILTKKCPTCDGDGIVVSEASTAVELERKLRTLAASKPRSRAFKVEVSAKPGSLLIGPGASRLEAIEASTRRRFFLELAPNAHLDHFAVLAEGTVARLKPESPVEEGTEHEVKLVEVGLHDPRSGTAKLDGLDICVADAAKLVGKKVKVRIVRVLDGTAYATPVAAQAPEPPITAETEAEKPTRASRAKKETPTPEPEVEAVAEPVEEEAVEGEGDAAVAAPPKRKTRRGSRGGRRRRKTGTAATNGAAASETAETTEAEAETEPAAGVGEGPRIHLPERELEAEAEAESTEAESVDGAAAPKKKTRRGSRGGRRRRKPAAAAVAESSENGESSA